MQSGEDGVGLHREARNPATGVLGGGVQTQTHAGRAPCDDGGGGYSGVCARPGRPGAAATLGPAGRARHRPACHTAASRARTTGPFGALASTMVTVHCVTESHPLVILGDSGPRKFPQGPSGDSLVTFLEVKRRASRTPGGILTPRQKGLGSPLPAECSGSCGGGGSGSPLKHRGCPLGPREPTQGRARPWLFKTMGSPSGRRPRTHGFV